jgi:hypothetical protein
MKVFFFFFLKINYIIFAYSARQLGFLDEKKCPQLCKLAYDYLRKAKGCEERIYEYFGNEADPQSLYVKLIQEFDKCILSYFAFHWGQASLMISEVNEHLIYRSTVLSFHV